MPEYYRKQCHTTIVLSEANVCGHTNRVLRPIRRGEEIVVLTDNVFAVTNDRSISNSDKNASKKLWKRKSKQEDTKVKKEADTAENIKELAQQGTQENETMSGYACQRCGKVFTYAYYRDKHLKYTRCVVNWIINVDKDVYNSYL